MEKNPLIQTVGLKKYFPVGKRKLHAVDDINISIQEGSTLGVVGESGCGKSTLGRTIIRLLEPTAGQIFYDGKDITNLSEQAMKEYREYIQIIFQDPYSSLNPRQSVSDAIAMPLKLHANLDVRQDIAKRTKELMDTVGLAQRLVNSYPHELDGGRRQRVCIARALALNPRFIVCDEPVSALDVSIQAQILNLLMDLQRDNGLTYMFITHDLSVVKHISDEIMVMYVGQCVEKAPYAELFKHPLHPYTRALLSAIPVPNISMRAKKAHVIRGEISTPIDPKPGCRFAPRCEHCSERCTGVDIPLNEVSPGHFVACPYAEENL
ncbi:MAG TPA: ATP-binding cassette domain-containing protein [Clostridia bacterium]|nr:ATP-binding cassette domain-containing protein [Clostridia bacterium]HPK16916.1 ATP-binding cassette domain-containing protein [Clostridia bacterium]